MKKGNPFMKQFRVYDADRQTLEKAQEIKAADAYAAAMQFAALVGNSLDRTIAVVGEDGSESIFGKAPLPPTTHLDD